MARYRFAGTADYVITVGVDNAATLQPGTTITAWNAVVGGSQYTDLTDIDGTTPIANGALVADSTGAVPEFYGPDGVASLYLDANGGNGPRRRTLATDLGDVVTSHLAATNPHNVTAAEAGAVPATDKGAANGVATLDASGLVPTAQLPPGIGAVSSVNGQTGAVSLTAVDVSAEAAGTAVLLTGDQTVAGTKTFSSVPASSAAPTTANHLARKSYVDAAAYAGSWGPADHGLAAWAFDPALAVSTGVYPGTSTRVTAVVLRAATTITRIVWVATGYAGGLAAGSWAALYNSAGTRVAQTGDLSTAGYEPAEVHNAGGATISSPLTAAYSAAAGVYYIAWRMAYNTTTGDGPMLLVAESSAGAPPNVFGYTPVRRFGVYSPGTSSAPASLTLSSMENGANRFWAGLA